MADNLPNISIPLKDTDMLDAQTDLGLSEFL